MMEDDGDDKDDTKRLIRLPNRTEQLSGKEFGRGSMGDRNWLHLVRVMGRLDLACPHCHLKPKLPVTAPCGHTSCYDCANLFGNCACGERYHKRLNIDVLLQKLLSMVQQTAIRRGVKRGRDYGGVAKRQRIDGVLLPYTCLQANGAVYDQPADRNPRLMPSMSNTVSQPNPSPIPYRLEGELECSICYEPFRQPLCTPCGHTFCRECIERVLDVDPVCPLCKANLANFNTDATLNTKSVCLALRCAGLPVDPPPEASDELPIFGFTVTFPGVSCPLHIFEPHYLLMLRRVMRSKDRRFGMVHMGTMAKYGTILELRDVVRMRDGRCVVTSIGVGRFRILQISSRDGYQVARIEILTDTSTHQFSELADLMGRMSVKMQHFLEERVPPATRAEILDGYGPMPPPTECSKDDGPTLCWWLLAIMPLPLFLKVTMLRTVCPMRRLWVLEHLLSFSDSDARSPKPTAAKSKSA